MKTEIPKSKYKCQRCLVYFERNRPGPVTCPNCGYNYIDWLNHIEVLKALKMWERK